MPWKESRILDQRLQFLSSYQKEEMSVADLCRAYGSSRPTAYRWINRYNEAGPGRTRGSKHSPAQLFTRDAGAYRKRHSRASGQASVLGRTASARL